MKKLSLFIIGLFGIMMFTGCTPRQPVVKYVPVTKVKYIGIPNELFDTNITLPKPPSKKEFVNAGPIEREKMLSKLIVNLYGVIKEYKLKCKKIKEYNNKMKQMMKDSKLAE